MNEKDRAVVLEVKNRVNSGKDFDPALDALLVVIAHLETEIEQSNAVHEALLRGRDPIAEFYKKEWEEANKPQQGPWIGDGGNIISRK